MKMVIRMKRKGFTLVEILAVVVILGLISGIAIISVTRYRAKALENERESIRGSVKAAFGNYRVTNSVKKAIVTKQEDDTYKIILPPEGSSMRSNTVVTLDNFRFDKPVRYNGEICSAPESYVYYVVRGDFGVQGTTSSGSKFTSKAEDVCLYLVCGDSKQVVIDDFNGIGDGSDFCKEIYEGN